MKRHAVLAFLVLLMVGGVALRRATAETVSLVAGRDNTIYESTTGALSNALGNGFFAGRTAQGFRRRGLVWFDVTTAVPAGAHVASARVILRFARGQFGEREVSLHRLVASWGEATSLAPGRGGTGAPATAGDATWTHRFHDSIAWSTPGGDALADADASRFVADTSDYVVWGPTPALTATVQSWLDDGASNHGWLVRGDESAPATARKFSSREELDPASRPRLVLEYTLGAAAGEASPERALELRLPRGGTFRDALPVEVALATATPARLAVLDVGGRHVASLWRGPLEAGTHRFEWTGRDDLGRSVPPGLYVVALTANGRGASRKLVRLR